MSNDWLTISSFEQSTDIIDAINILATHTKFILAGVEDPTSDERIDISRNKLGAFLERLQSLLDENTDEPEKSFLGTDPRMAELVQKFIVEQRTTTRSVHLHRLPINEVLRLLDSENPDKLSDLIGYLSELRTVIEQHVQTDVDRMLGKL